VHFSKTAWKRRETNEENRKRVLTGLLIPA